MTGSTDVGSVAYEPFDGLVAGDPYDVYAALRELAPVHFNERHGFWAVSRHDDVIAVMRDWESFSTSMGVDIDDTGAAYGSGDFLEEDPPRHDVLRAVVRGHFVPKRLRADLEPCVRAELRALLADIPRGSPVDLASELAWPLPVAVGAMLLGLPRADRDALLGLQRRMAERVPGMRELPPDARAAAAELRAYFAELVERRRRDPGDDLVTTIARARPDGRPIGDDAVGMLFLLFVASMETTASSIGNALVLLARHPDQRRELARNPEAIGRAVEEVLRFEAPVQVTKRVATRETSIGETRIPEDGEVFLVLASANRDERRYERATEFDIDRPPLRHLAFGDGIHHCLGAPLARLELRMLLEELIGSRVEVRLEGAGTRLSSHFIRGFAELPATLS